MPGHPNLARTLACIAVVTASAGAAAQEPPPMPTPARAMTLQEATAYAREHQPAMRVALSRVRARMKEAEVPDAQWKPVVGATAQMFGGTANNTTASYVASDYMDIPRIGGTPSNYPGVVWPAYVSSFVGVSAAKQIFDFGRISAQTAAADALVDVERHATAATQLDITYDVEEAFFAVLMAKQIVLASDEAFDRSRAHRDLAKAGVGSGLRSPIELTRAEADLTRFDVGRVRARGGLALAQNVFAAVVGVEDAGLDTSGPAPSASEMPSLAAGLQHAAAKDPRVLRMVAQLKASQAETKAIGAELKPDVWITGAITGRAGGAPATNGAVPEAYGLLPYIPNWSVGVVLTWPLYDPVIAARRDAAQAREDIHRDEIALLRHDQVAAIRSAFAAVEVAKAALPALERALEAARANYAQADARFKGGLGTSVELADAEALRTQAEIELAQGQFEVARARAAFGRAIAEGA